RDRRRGRQAGRVDHRWSGRYEPAAELAAHRPHAGLPAPQPVQAEHGNHHHLIARLRKSSQTIGGRVSVAAERVEEGAASAKLEDIDEFRRRVHQFLLATVPRRSESLDDEGIAPGGVHGSSAELVASVKAYQAALFDANLAGLTWPVEYGGQGLVARHQKVFNEEAAAFEVTTRIVGIG